MKQEVEIILAEIFNNTLDTRESVQTLLSSIQDAVSDMPDPHVILNFDQITFMSRSFADEFHKTVTQKDIAYTFTFKNMEGDLLTMLKMVEKTQNQRTVKARKSTTITIKDAATLRDYAFAW